MPVPNAAKAPEPPATTPPRTSTEAADVGDAEPDADADAEVALEAEAEAVVLAATCEGLCGVVSVLGRTDGAGAIEAVAAFPTHAPMRTKDAHILEKR